MSEPTDQPEKSATREVVGADLEAVENHLERRFPDADADQIQDAIEVAAEDLADAKITTFRSLLVEHNASDALRAERDSSEPESSPSSES